MCTQNAFRYWNRIAYDDDLCRRGTVDGRGRPHVPRAWATRTSCSCATTASSSRGPTVAQAYDDLYYLERTAMVQVLAMQTGRPLHNIDEALAEHTARQIAGDVQQAILHFEIAEAPARPGRARLAQVGGQTWTDTGETTMRIATCRFDRCSLALPSGAAALPALQPGAEARASWRSRPTRKFPRPRRRSSSPPTPRWRATCAAR